MNNNQHISESFEVGDLHLVLMPRIEIDMYASKIGKDDEICVVSFLVNDKTAAQDLVSFFENGYEWILDADISASEVKPGSYLVFIEILRRVRLIHQLLKLLSDLSAASKINKNEWKFRYVTSEKYYPLTVKALEKHVPLTARAYKDKVVAPIKEMQMLSGIPIYEHSKKDLELEAIQHAAGIQ